MTASYRDRLEDFFNDVKQKVSRFVSKTKRRLRRQYIQFRRKLRNKWNQQWRAIFHYGVYEFTPYILVYGALLNAVTMVFFGMEFSSVGIVSHGIGWYFLKEEVFGEMIPNLKPEVRVEANVKDRR